MSVVFEGRKFFCQNERQVNKKDAWVGKGRGGGAVAELHKALLVRENKPKPKDPRFTLPALAIFKKDAWVRRLLLSSEVSA